MFAVTPNVNDNGSEYRPPLVHVNTQTTSRDMCMRDIPGFLKKHANWN